LRSRDAALVLELRGLKASEPAMLSREVKYYFVTLCVPAGIIALFVLYVYLKDRHGRP
jgi:hypothetical protein